MRAVAMTKILIPVDFSSTSLSALAHAEELANRSGAELLLLTVIEPVIAPVDFNVAAIIEVNQTEQMAAKLEKLRKTAVRQGVSTVTLMGEGEPAAVIVSAAAEQHCDLIVMGTHGHSGFRRLLLGSKTERVVRGAACPVLTVGPSH